MKQAQNTARNARRGIPSVEHVVQALGETGVPRPLVVQLVRDELSRMRRTRQIQGEEILLRRLGAALEQLKLQRLMPVVNGTGVALHTNLGRAPLGLAARSAFDIAAGYCNLEYDLSSGRRGSRGAYVERCLELICGAEAAVVLNNCAAALVSVLRCLTSGAKKEVIVSRGELVQIGGGFRIAEILESSGAKLREVGATNKTSAGDYAQALGPNTALILKVHRSNFVMSGFVESPAREALALIARKHRVPLVEDLGSGVLVATDRWFGLEREPTPREALRHGIEAVCFSGDKLLGGPQAGIIAGRKRLVSAVKADPLFRAMRCDKMVLAALQTTLEAYLEPEAAGGKQVPEVPLLKMLHQPLDELRARAESMKTRLAGVAAEVTIGATRSAPGGGTLPQSEMDSVVLEIAPKEISANEFARRLRVGVPPIVGLTSGGRFKLDLRTLLPEHGDWVVNRLVALLSNG